MDEMRPIMGGEELDAAAFGRVWRRVMPEDRPDCPFTLDDPPAPAPAPVEQTPLAGLVQRLADARRTYRALARRWGSRPLAELGEEKERQVKELTAALFLLTGEKPGLDPTPAPERLRRDQALRERWRAELDLAEQARAAAAQADDPLLRALLPDLAGRCEGQARQIWALLARS